MHVISTCDDLEGQVRAVSGQERELAGVTAVSPGRRTFRQSRWRFQSGWAASRPKLGRGGGRPLRPVAARQWSTVYLALGSFLKARDHGDGEFVALVGSSDFRNLMTLNSVDPETVQFPRGGERDDADGLAVDDELKSFVLSDHGNGLAGWIRPT